MFQQNKKLALIGFNRDLKQLQTEKKFVEETGKIVFFTNWLIREELIETYKKQLPFKLYINVGNKTIKYAYRITDFITQKGSKGIPCPEEWKKYLCLNKSNFEILTKYNYSKYLFGLSEDVIKTWFLVDEVIKFENDYGWENLKSDIHNREVQNPGKSYFLYVEDPFFT